jgi:hypothetical protein
MAPAEAHDELAVLTVASGCSLPVSQSQRNIKRSNLMKKVIGSLCVFVFALTVASGNATQCGAVTVDYATGEMDIASAQ